jgi:hypothetical protein
MDLALFESVLRNCDADRRISGKSVPSSVILESKCGPNVELVLLTMLIFQSHGFEYERMQSARRGKSYGLSQILQQVSACKSVDLINLVTEIADGLINRADMVHFARNPFISQNYQLYIIRTVKHLLLDPNYKRLSRTRQLLSCTLTGTSILSKNNYVPVPLRDETSSKSRDQAKQLSKVVVQAQQLSAIFKSNISKSEASFKEFRLQHISDKPTLIGNSVNSWSKNFVFSKNLAISYEGSFAHLIGIMEGLAHRQGENSLSSSDSIEVTVNDYLDFTSQFCLGESSATPAATPTVGACSDLNFSRTPSKDRSMDSYRLCGAFLAYLVNSSPPEDQALFSSEVMFSLASKLREVLGTFNLSCASVQERSDAESAFVHVISLSCGLLFEVFLSYQYPCCATNTNTRTTHTSTDTGIDTLNAQSIHPDSPVQRASLEECLELLSWTASIATSLSGKTIKSDDAVSEEVAVSTLAVDTVESNDVLNGEYWLGVDATEKEKGTDLEAEDVISTLQMAFRNFFVIPFFKYLRIHGIRLFEALCTEYLVCGLYNQINSETCFPSNSREMYHHQVDDVFYAVSAPHRSAIIGWSEHSLNPKVFFSIYVLQCAMMKAFSSIFEGEPQHLDSKIPDSTVFDRNDKMDVQRLSRCRILRKECHSLIVNIAIGLLPASQDLFLRILCDAASCAIAIEVEKRTEHRSRSTDNSSDNSNSSSNADNITARTQKETEKETQKESSPPENIPNISEENSHSRENALETIVAMVLEIAECSGIPIPMVLTAMTESKNYHPKGSSDIFDPQNPGVFSSVREMAGELGSGITAAVVILLKIKSDQHGDEVLKYRLCFSP